MEYYILASGSKGNCTVIKDKNSMIIIDCGTTNRHLTHSFHSLALDYKSVDGVLITHTHKDHIGRINMFKFADIYTPESLDGEFNQEVVHPYQSFRVGDFLITPIELSHDTDTTLGYVIESSNEKLVYVTDTGYFKDDDLKYIENANYYIFESNHDPELLMNTNRPYYIKQRIMSMNGHLCNVDAAEILAKAVGDQTTEVVLAHLSEEGNNPDLAIQVARERINDSNIIIKAAKQFDIVQGGTL